MRKGGTKGKKKEKTGRGPLQNKEGGKGGNCKERGGSRLIQSF